MQRVVAPRLLPVHVAEELVEAVVRVRAHVAVEVRLVDALEGLEADGDLGPVLPLAERLPELLDRVELREVVVEAVVALAHAEDAAREGRARAEDVRVDHRRQRVGRRGAREAAPAVVEDAGELGRPRLRRLLDGVGRRRRRRDGAGAGDALERRSPVDGRRARRERGGGVDEKRERSRAG